jgi:hypothetical protein
MSNRNVLDFINCGALDIDIALRDYEEHNFYAQFNKTDATKQCSMKTVNNCFGAFKMYQIKLLK